MAQVQRASSSAVDIPFDLNKIFSLTYEFQPLKEVLEYIFGQLKKNEDRIHQVDTKLVSKLLMLDKLKNDGEDFKTQLKHIRDICKELEQKSVNVDQDVFTMKTDIEACKMNLSLLIRQMSSIPNRVYEVEDKLEEFNKRLDEMNKKIEENSTNVAVSQVVTDGGFDINALTNLLKEYFKKNEGESLISRVEKIEKEQKSLQDSQEATENKLTRQTKKHKKWRPKWVQMQKDIEDLKKLLKDKVDNSFLQDELDKLKNLINQLASSGKDIQMPLIPTGPQLSSKEIAELKELIQKVEKLEDKTKNLDVDKIMNSIHQLQAEISEKADKAKTEKDIQDIYAKLEQMHKDMMKFQESLKECISKISFLEQNSHRDTGTKVVQSVGVSEQEFKKLVDRVDKLEQLLQEYLKSSKTVEMASSDNIGDQALKDIMSKLQDLQKQIENLRNEFAKWIKEMQDGLNKKADIDALNNLEKLILEKINEVVRAFTKQFADKNDTKKAIKLLERQIKNLFDIIMQNNAGQSHHDHEDDAMFTKKPLGGMSCASCEKDIINLQGKKVNYYPWSKLPVRDPSERIARVGQGFSKMLSMINPDVLTKQQENPSNSKNRYKTIINANRVTNQLYSSQGMRGVKNFNQLSQENFYQHDEGHDSMPDMGQLKPTIASDGTIGMKTTTNFYKSQNIEDLSKRPGSASLIPKPKITNKFIKNQNSSGKKNNNNQ